jgi:hypothetical protein
MPNEHRNPTQTERDERITLPLDAETALRALLRVKPGEDDSDNENGDSQNG